MGLFCLLLTLGFSSNVAGAQVSPILIDPGPQSTNNYCNTDLAIDGPGYFLVRDPVSGDLAITRQGEFRVTWERFLVTPMGERLQGWTDLAAKTVGDLRVGSGVPPVTEWQISSNGELVVTLADGTSFTQCRILLVPPPPVESLRPFQGYLYQVDGEIKPVPPGSPGVGVLRPWWLESLRPAAIPPSLAAVPGRSAAQPQGRITWTGLPSDMAIRGPGFLLVRAPDTGALFATRAGAFMISEQDYLVTYRGYRLQGWVGPDQTEWGDLRIAIDSGSSTDSNRASVVSNYGFQPNGELNFTRDNGVRVAGGCVALQLFENPGALEYAGDGLYRITAAALPASKPVRPCSESSGRLISAGLELSHIPRVVIRQRLQLQYQVQGMLRRTENALDLAIGGSGFFLLRRPADNRGFATRAGAFELDPEGFIVTRCETQFPVEVPGGVNWPPVDRTIPGLRLQGWTSGEGTAVGDLRIDAGSATAGDPGVTLSSWAIDGEGRILVTLSDGREFVRGQVLLQNFRSPCPLRLAQLPTGPTAIVFTGFDQAGSKSALRRPAIGGTGCLMSGCLERVQLGWRPLRDFPLLGADAVPEPRGIPSLAPTGNPLTLADHTGPWFTLTGAPFSHCAVEATSDFVAWHPLGEVDIDEFGRAEFLPPPDAAALGSSTIPSVPRPLFFRARLE